jgi:hypothetical protein
MGSAQPDGVRRPRRARHWRRNAARGRERGVRAGHRHGGRYRRHGRSPISNGSSCELRRWRNGSRRRNGAAGSTAPGKFVGFDLNQVNDDCLVLKDVHIWAFARIRGNCRPHSASTCIHWVSRLWTTIPSVEAGGDLSVGFVSPAREFSISGNLTSLAMSEPPPPLADGDHCREMAGKVRELARTTRSPGIRRELIDLAKRYDRRGDHFDRRPSPNF